MIIAGLVNCARSNERTQAALRNGEAEVFEFSVGTMNSVGIDRYLRNHFSHRRQLISRLEPTSHHRLSHLINELAIGRHPTARIEPESDGWMVRCHVLVH